MLALVRRQQRVFLSVLGLVLLLGAYLRLYDVGSKTMTHIEMYVPGIVMPKELADPAPRLTIRDTLNGILVYEEPHPPAYYLMMLAWTRFFGSGIIALRLPSVFFGIASVVLIFVLGTLEYDKWTAVTSAGLLALNGHQIFWSELAKMYVMACFLGLLATIFFVGLLSNRRPSLILSILYLVFMLGGLSTTTYFWPLFATHILVGLTRKWANKESLVALLRLQIMIFLLASPLWALAAFQSRRASYLGTDLLAGLGQYWGFGFLFEPDPFSTPPTEIPLALTLLLVLFALVLFLFGMSRQRSADIKDAVIASPRLMFLAAAGLLALATVLVFARYTNPFDPGVTNRVLLTTILPPLLLIGAFLVGRYADAVFRLANGLNGRLSKLPGLNSLTIFLAVLPVLMIAAVSPIVPLFASRGVLLYVPYLILILAAGMVTLISRSKAWLTLVPLLGVILTASVIYFKSSYIEDPTDYKGLAEQWIPQIQDSDLILIQRHWATTPILYYLNGSRYRLIGSDYVREFEKRPNGRAWVFSTDGVPPSSAMLQAVRDYTLRETLTARRVRVVLYVKNGEVTSGQAPPAPSLGSVIPIRGINERQQAFKVALCCY